MLPENPKWVSHLITREGMDKMELDIELRICVSLTHVSKVVFVAATV